MSAASFNLAILGQSNFIGFVHHRTTQPRVRLFTAAKFNPYEIFGGRGLCNGEENLQKELKKSVSIEPSSQLVATSKSSPSASNSIPVDGFEKELLGLTGGFPGGERGLKNFIAQNPLPREDESLTFDRSLVMKPKPPEFPLLLPGMIAIVKNPNNPFYMYCGIVQRISDGKAGVLFEGGNWDRLVTFRLEELERREKGPPMVNPKSVIIENLVELSK